MTEGLTRSLRIIHQLERSIRVLESVRDGIQQELNETTASYEKQAGSANWTVAESRAHIADCNRAILGAKARIAKLERVD
jgi:hypothetical protein